MAEHELTTLFPENKVGASRSSWGWKAVCKCGWNSGPFLRSRKGARREYLKHKELAVTVAQDDEVGGVLGAALAPFVEAALSDATAAIMSGHR